MKLKLNLYERSTIKGCQYSRERYTLTCSVSSFVAFHTQYIEIFILVGLMELRLPVFQVYGLTKERDTLRREQNKKSDAAALLKEKDEIINQVMAEGVKFF